VLDKLSAAANAALKTAALVKALDAQGIDPLGSTPAEFAAFIRADFAKWTDVMTKAGLIK
jgi:tripartite-type tricarboxylate transporter receptor subunit TctC